MIQVHLGAAGWQAIDVTEFRGMPRGVPALILPQDRWPTSRRDGAHRIKWAIDPSGRARSAVATGLERSAEMNSF